MLALPGLQVAASWRGSAPAGYRSGWGCSGLCWRGGSWLQVVAGGFHFSRLPCTLISRSDHRSTVQPFIFFKKEKETRAAMAKSTRTLPRKKKQNTKIKNSASQNKNKKTANNCHIKHPNEASDYLIQWKKKNGWKFSKNTQSWLIRHMYDVGKVPKSSFVLLLDYLEGLEGKATRDRIRAEASRRVRRHKEYCKSTPKTAIELSTQNEQGNNNKNNDTGSLEKKEATTTEQVGEMDVENDEEVQWRKLDDHDKRKQYKRARQILNLMKECDTNMSES